MSKLPLPAKPAASLLPFERLARLIVMFRGERVMLDRDLAELYGVEVRALNQAVRRNLNRFPADFAFELTRPEIHDLAALSGDSGIRRVRAVYAFTEHGVAMLSSVLHSERAVKVNIAIMRAFVQLRRLLATHAELAAKIHALESKYDAQFKAVIAVIEELTAAREVPRREIGFHTLLPKSAGGSGSSSRKKSS